MTYRKKSANAAQAFRPREREFSPVQSVLSRALKRYGLDRNIARYQFVLHWKDIVGEDIAKRSKPDSLRNGTLVVSVSSSAWAQELSFYKGVILQRLKKFIGDSEVVEDVRFRVEEGSFSA